MGRHFVAAVGTHGLALEKLTNPGALDVGGRVKAQSDLPFPRSIVETTPDHVAGDAELFGSSVF
jgi:hypothetical protein